MSAATIENHIADIARKIVAEELARVQTHQDEEAIDTRSRIQKIMAKEFITISEAAFLLSCSRSHVDNLIGRARDGETDPPIPLRDLDGITVFNREELLAWSRETKFRKRKAA